MNGGLDLDNGTAVAFNSGEAELQDEGINLNASPGTENWRAQISGVNDAEVRLADVSMLGDGVTFVTVNTQEMIQMAFDQGSALDGNDDFPNADGDLSADEEVSQPILGEAMDRPGEVFAVRKGDNYYLVRFDAVNYVAASERR